MTLDEIKQLDEYRGSTPVPKDFEAFWQKRMEEADQIPLEYTISPSSIPSFPGCEYLELRFTGFGGGKVYAKYLKSTHQAKSPMVLQFHGYPGASRSWLEQSSFAGMGFSLIAMDCPGQGGYSQDPGGFTGTTVSGHIIAGLDGRPEDMYYVRLHQTIRILCRIVSQLEEVDQARVYVNGASQGGALGLACAALNPDLIGRAAILYPFLSDYRKVWELGADQIAYEGLRYYSRWFDPDGSRMEEWMGRLAYIDTMNFADLVKCPVLFGTDLSDEVCPPMTQCAVFNRLKSPKKRWIFSGHGHAEIQEFDDLILNFFGKEEVDFG